MTAPNFTRAFPLVLAEEGGYIDNPKDHGGRTMLGVTWRNWTDWSGVEPTLQSFQALTARDMEPFYRKRYWDGVHGDDMPGGVDLLLFDSAVQHGVARVVTWLQRDALFIASDGLIGPKTLAAVSAVGAPIVIERLRIRRESFYRSQSFDRFAECGRGWTARMERITTLARQWSVEPHV